MQRWVFFALLLAGCTPQTPPIAETRVPLLGAQLTRQDDQLVGQRFRTLLDFEHDADAVFVHAGHVSIALPAHTGDHALLIEGEEATISIAPLFYGMQMPGEWTLAGGYVRLAGMGGRLQTSLVADGKTVASSQRDVAPDVWVFAGIGLTDPTLSASISSAKRIDLVIQTQTDRFLLDDVLLVNNKKFLTPTTLPEVPAWTVERDGFATKIKLPGKYSLSIPSSVGDLSGWNLQEAGPIRVRFTDSQNRTLILYADGRLIRGGTMSLPPGTPQALAASHEHPAEITIDESTGRLNRDSVGDANNDGYNETLGSYQIMASGSRVSLRIVPRDDTPVASPVFEIKNLPGQEITAMVEGRLFRSTWRIDANTVLVMLPITIDRATEVTIKASANSSDSASSTHN